MDQQLMHEFNQIGVHMNQIVDKYVSNLSLSKSQFLILLHLQKNGSMTIKQLSAQMNLNQGNTSSTCKQLEKMGYLIRERQVDDERVVKLNLTQEAIEQTSHFHQLLAERISISEQEKQLLHDSAKLINEKLQNFINQQ